MDSWLIWCNLNTEQDALERLFAKDCVSVRGADSESHKIEAERKWRIGEVPIMISKPSIFGFGMNWMHCHNVVFVGLSDSWESVYQATRRCWRFGQIYPVQVHFITGELEGAVSRNVERKEKQAAAMAQEMLGHMRAINTAEIRGTVREQETYKAKKAMELPSWL